MAKINIPSIKAEIKSILDTNNTTTSSFLDLSDGMSKRVLQVATLNPEKYMIQATKYPAVTIYTSQKPIEPKTIAKNQVNGKRLARLTFTIVGMVWNQNFSSDIFADPSDDDLENLMENIEQILRNYPDLNASVNWQIPNNVTYHSANIDEESHFRVGLMDIETTIYY